MGTLTGARRAFERIRRWAPRALREIAHTRPSVFHPPPPEHAPFLPDAAVGPVRPRARRGANATLARPPSIDPRPEISVVLGSFNRLVLLQRAIQSVRGNFGARRGEIIVIDGGSTDGSIEWLVQQPDIVTIVQHNRYRDESGALRRRMSWGRFMNIGFRAAGADHIVMISDDCYLLPGALDHAISRVAEAKAAGVRVGGCAFYFRDWPLEQRYYVQRTVGGNLMINHGLYERNALLAAGYANEDEFAFYKADSDLSLAIWAAGYAIIDAPQSICEHFMNAAEAARATNNATLEFDREQLHRRWPELTTREAALRMGKHYSDFTDPENTVARVFADQLEETPPSARAGA